MCIPIYTPMKFRKDCYCMVTQEEIPFVLVYLEYDCTINVSDFLTLEFV